MIGLEFSANIFVMLFSMASSQFSSWKIMIGCEGIEEGMGGSYLWYTNCGILNVSWKYWAFFPEILTIVSEKKNWFKIFVWGHSSSPRYNSLKTKQIQRQWGMLSSFLRNKGVKLTTPLRFCHPSPTVRCSLPSGCIQWDSCLLWSPFWHPSSPNWHLLTFTFSLIFF